MNILIISFSNNYDHQRSIYTIYDELSKRNISVFTLGIKNPKYSYHFSQNNLFIDAPTKPGLSLKAFKLNFIKQVNKIISNNKIDLVYFESLHIWNVPFLVFKSKKYKIIHSIHDLYSHDSKNKFFINIFNWLIVKKSNRIIFRSKTSLELAKSKYKSKHSRKFCFVPLLRNIGPYLTPNFSNTFMFFGRISEYKGLDALYSVISSCPNFHFLIVGKPIDKPGFQFIEKIKLFANVTIDTNYVSEEKMIKYFSECDAILLPYKSATQSGVIVDSNSFSKPCIAYSVGAIKEQIVDGKTGFLVDCNTNEFISALSHFSKLSDCEKNSLCRNAYDFALKNYSAPAVASIFLDIFKVIN